MQEEQEGIQEVPHLRQGEGNTISTIEEIIAVVPIDTRGIGTMTEEIGTHLTMAPAEEDEMIPTVVEEVAAVDTMIIAVPEEEEVVVEEEVEGATGAMQTENRAHWFEEVQLQKVQCQSATEFGKRLAGI